MIENAAFRGSGTGDIAEFEPRQSNDIEEFGNRRAVYAASDGLWAMYFAIVDRDRYVTSLYNACYRLGPAPEGPFGEPRYFFSVNEDALDHVPWRAGTVYLLPADGFAEQPPMRLGDQWLRPQQVAKATPARPAARLSVEPADFPLLASIHGHDRHGRITPSPIPPTAAARWLASAPSTRRTSCAPHWSPSTPN